uniref:FAD-dependent oxidoreductase domain-containing protein 1 n=1 Tax=Syphacia muris TaxID=451379 RepID=A0A158R5J2_9BILA
MKRILESSQLLRSLTFFHTSSSFRWQDFENERHYEPGEDVRKRVWHALTYDFRRWKRRYKEARYDAFRRRYVVAHMKRAPIDNELFPYRTEVLIIGGGLTGSSIAYWIKQAYRDEDFKVTVVENNDKFDKSSTMLSYGGISQQFSIPEHIEMSMFTAEFLRHSGEHLRILDNDPPDISFFPMGYMHLACNEAEAEKMKECWKLQVGKGVRVALHNRDELRQRFPFMNFDDVLLGTYGLENEGCIDSWQLLSAIREKNLTLGVQYLKGEVEGFMYRYDGQEVHGFEPAEVADEVLMSKRKLIGAYVRPQMTDASARPIRFHFVVNAAGPWAREVAEMAHIGKGKGLLSVKLPVVPRKRTAYVIHAPEAPALGLPAFVDPSGVFCIQEEAGNTFICGKTPKSLEEDRKIDHSNLDIDYDYFYNEVWPLLILNVFCVQTAIKNAWARYEDVNLYDNAPVIGEHLLHKNYLIACGFGERGIQHSIAAARGICEKIYEYAFITINLRKFDMRRFISGRKLEEITFV